MARLACLYILLFITPSVSFPQSTISSDSISSSGNQEFYLSLDTKSKKLLIPAGHDSLKIFGIKIFNIDGKELLSKKVSDPSKSFEMNISALASGEYIVHIVTTKQEIYKTKFTLKW